jgi:hypothetical protein
MESPEGFDDFLKVMSRQLEVFSGVEPKRQEIIRELVSAKGGQFPESLFHYTNFKSISGIVESNNLWATDFQSLNDATELVHGARLLVDELEKHGNETGGDKSVLLNKLANYYKEHGDTYRSFFETYIISFSEDSDMLSQWRAYSDQAKGCCIEFNFTDSRLFTIVSENTPWVLEVLPVIYDESLQRKLIKSGIQKMLGYLDSTAWSIQKLANSSEMEQGVVLGLLMHSFEPFITAFKHAGFSEEKEWRAVVSCASNLTVTKKKERQTDSGTASYLECIFMQGDDASVWQREFLPITGIKHGPLAEEDTIENIKNRLVLYGYKNQVAHSKSGIPLK